MYAIHQLATVNVMNDPSAFARQYSESLKKGKTEPMEVRHLNAVLSSIRDVNRLIIKEKKRKPLIEGVCASLVANRGFHNAWIILLDDDNAITASAEAGLGMDFAPILENIENGNLMQCCMNVVEETRLWISEHPDRDCAGCPVSRNYQGRGAMSAPLSHNGKRHGIITVSVPAAFTRNPEEQEIFRDVADDIGYALHSIEVDEDRLRKEDALRETRDKLERRVKERTAELETLSTKLLNAQEEERKRIASDLHDGIGQCLSAVKFMVETSLEQMSGKVDDGDLKSLHALVPLLQEASEEVRTIVMNLRPSILDDLGILATIRWFCRQFQAVYSYIRIDERIEVAEEQVPDPLKTIVFRILQESMNNISKHSQANRVALRLIKTDNDLILRIRDNGCGFDAVSASVSGFGITGMKERAELSGGRFSLHSVPGEGTTVEAIWAYTCIRAISW